MHSETLETAKQLVQIGKENIIQTEHDGIPIIVIPNNMKIEALTDMVDDRREKPHQLKQTVTTLSSESFIEYFNRFASEHSTVFVDTEDGVFVGVLDYHQGQNRADWKRHKVVYSCPQTQEWKDWIIENNASMTQTEFALFIEDHMNQVTQPNGSELLKIATTLKAKSEVDFKSNIRLDNGEVQFTYNEVINGAAGEQGQFSIPEEFTLAIKPLQNGAPYELKARFRYRKTPNGLKMWYTLQQPHICMDDAINDVLESIKEKIEKGHVVLGKI